MKFAEHNHTPQASFLPGALIGRVLSLILLLGVSSFPGSKAVGQLSDVIETFPTGLNPAALTSDGANIWVVCSGGVNKLRASDGADLGTFATGGGGGVDDVFDGENIWVTNDVGTVGKLRASDGALLGVFEVNDPFAIGFDGTSIWVTSVSDSTVTKLRASDGMLEIPSR